MRLGRVRLAWLSIPLFCFVGVAQAEVVVTAPPAFYQGQLEPNLYFRPSQLATAPDGSLYVQDDLANKIHHFSASGGLLNSFPSPASFDRVIYGMATDAAGNLHALNTLGELSVFSPTGELQSELELTGSAIGPIAIGADGETYLARSGYREVYRVDSTGDLTRFTEQHSDYWVRDLQFNSQGELFTLREGGGPIISVYDSTGALQREFEIPSHPYINDVNPGKLAVTGDSIYLYDDYLASVRRFSLTGEPLGIAYGVPYAPDLAVTASGDVLASSPSLRVVERISPDMFGADSVGTTRVSVHAPHLVNGTRLSSQLSLDLSEGWQESAARSFIVPGAPGEMVSLRFDRIPETGSPSDDVISVFPVDAVTADPRESHAQYILQAFENSLAHLPSNFNGTLGEIEVPAGVELGFVSFSNRWGPLLGTSDSHVAAYRDRLLSQFRRIGSDPRAEEVINSRFFEGIQRTEGQAPLTQFPYASDPLANWGHTDQFAFFLGENQTVLLMENLNLLSSVSDANMIDVGILINARLIPTPEPASAILLAGVLSCLLRRTRG